MRLYTTLIFLFFALFSFAQPPARMKLTQLERGPVDTVRRGYIGMTDTAGNQRYTRYVQNLNGCLTYTPATFETNPFYFSKFVRKCGTDSIWYIDYNGFTQPINGNVTAGLPTVPINELCLGTGSPGYQRAFFAGFGSPGMDVWGGKSYNLLNTTTGNRIRWAIASGDTISFMYGDAANYGHYIVGKNLLWFRNVNFFGDRNNDTDFNAEFTQVTVFTPGSKLTGVRHGTNYETTRKIVIQNIGSNDLIIENESAASAAENRFSIGSNYTLQPGKSIAFWYQRGSVNRWKFYEPQQTGSGGITSLNGLTASTQAFATGTSGTDFNISSTGSTHTFNLPEASASASGKVNTGVQTFAGVKTFQNDVVCQDELRVTGGILDVGQNATTAGVINLYGATSNAIQVAVPASPSNYVLTLPQNAGSAGQVLTTDGTGVTSWAATGAPVIITPPEITTHQNDYSPTDFATATTVILTSNEVWSITGFSATGIDNGEQKTLYNNGNFYIVLTANDDASASGNRMSGSKFVYIAPKSGVTIVYNSNSWIVIGGEPDQEFSYIQSWNAGSTTAADWGNVSFNAILSGTVSSVAGPSGKLPFSTLISSAATSTGGGSIAVVKASTTGYFVQGQVQAFCEGVFYLPILSTSVERYVSALEFCTSTTVNTAGNNSIGVRYRDDVNSGKLQGYCVNSGGTISAIDLGVTPSVNTPIKIRIELMRDNSSVHFFINDAFAGKITTVTPTNQNYFARLAHLKLNGTTARTMNCISLKAGSLF